MLDLHRLWLLREFAQRGTIHAVATALGYSPSAVSQQLTKLQSEVGVPLLERSGRRLHLTPQAQILVGHTDAVLSRLEQAEAEIAASGPLLTGMLRVAAFQSVALALVPATLALLAQRHPGMRIEIAVREPIQAIPGLEARDFDVIVDEHYPGEPRAHDDRFDREELLSDPVSLVVPRSWEQADDIHGLADRPWTMEPPGTSAHTWTMAYCRDLGFEPALRFPFGDLPLRLRFIETGHAVSLLPDLAGARNTRNTRTLPLPGEPARRISTLSRAAAKDHPLILAFRAALHEVANCPSVRPPTTPSTNAEPAGGQRRRADTLG